MDKNFEILNDELLNKFIDLEIERITKLKEYSESRTFHGSHNAQAENMNSLPASLLGIYQDEQRVPKSLITEKKDNLKV